LLGRAIINLVDKHIAKFVLKQACPLRVLAESITLLCQHCAALLLKQDGILANSFKPCKPFTYKVGINHELSTVNLQSTGAVILTLKTFHFTTISIEGFGSPYIALYQQ
jgi:hypothetical protein